ncbi:MAG: hypothetical protein ACJA01_002044, partial [Saprospiraceae bacterium]
MLYTNRLENELLGCWQFLEIVRHQCTQFQFMIFQVIEKM